MFHEEPMSDEEINRYQNFDNLLKKRSQLLATRRYRHLALYSAALVAILSIGVVAYYQFQSTEPVRVKKTEPLATTKPATGNLPKVAGKPDKGSIAIPKEKVQSSKREASIPQQSPSQPTTSPEVKTTSTDSRKVGKRAVALSPKVEQVKTPSVSNFTEAEPAEGYPALYDYFKNALQYPAQARKDSITGSVLVGFAINKSGDAENISIVKGLREDLDKEAIRLIDEMPLWNPAQLNGKPITTRLVVPLNFQLSELKRVPK